MAYQILVLKIWRTEMSTRFWEKARVKKAILEGLTMLDSCLVVLAKSRGLVAIPSQLIKFLKPWQGVSKNGDGIFLCLKLNCLSLRDKIDLPLSNQASRNINL